MSSNNSNTNPNSNNDAREFTLPPVRLSRGVNLENCSNSSSSSSSARSTLDDFDVADFAKASFVAEPVFRSLDVTAPPPALTRHLDEPVLKEPVRVSTSGGPSGVLCTSSSGASGVFTLPTTLPTVDHLYKDTLPATSFTTVAITSRSSSSQIVSRVGTYLSKKSITFTSKSHSPHLLKCTAFGATDPTPCVFYVNVFKDYESESVLVECSRWSGSCLTFVPLMKQIFLSADDSLNETNDSVDVGSNKSSLVDATCLDRVAGFLNVSGDVKEEELKNALSALGYYASSSSNTHSICSHPTLLSLLTYYAVDSSNDEIRLLGLNALRNLLCNAETGSKLVKQHYVKVEELCKKLTLSASNVGSNSHSLQAALLALESLNALMGFSRRVVKVVVGVGGEEVYKKCKEVGMGRHLGLVEVAVEGATELMMCGK
ncbi:hypothetical protein TrLO_g12019 [Triparma laevis f. longispina]|uniref:Uncharacterized protein n=1 Tax=Triparma laevis f. longispina TaxID=1714387 RepID=A0A9W7KZZ8_9STRA|nr:hypothetical protein TrLO_g12019 [Triparma laevis f. longispina]